MPRIIFKIANKQQQAPPTTTARRAGTVRGRRDNRNSTAVVPTFGSSEQSIPETSSAGASPAVSPAPAVQTPIVAPAVQPLAAAPAVSDTLTSSPSGEFGSVPASTFSPFATQPPQEIPPASQPSMDTQSVRSATTTGSQGGIKHPDLHEPGLNSSIVETINVRFENGKVVNHLPLKLRKFDWKTSPVW
jgi:F-BAR domain only protein